MLGRPSNAGVTLKSVLRIQVGRKVNVSGRHEINESLLRKQARSSFIKPIAGFHLACS